MLNGVNPKDVPRDFYCPITLALMEEPVIVADGYSYEKKAIEDWFGTGNDTSPMTGERLQNKNFMVNKTLKNAITEFREKGILPEEEKAVAVVNKGNEEARVLKEQVDQLQREQQELRQKLAISARFFNALPLPSHGDLMSRLAKDLDVIYLDVYSGTAVEQIFVGFAGIYTDQSGSFYRRDNDGNTFFQLRLNNEQECLRLKGYYHEQFEGFIIGHEVLGDGKYKVTVDSRKLFSQVSPSLGQYKKDGHQELMKKLVGDLGELGAILNDNYEGKVIEQVLVSMAGIESAQNNASNGRDNKYYKTYFDLSFANEAEYMQFNDYYNNNFPGLIINACYKEHGLSHIEMNSRILSEEVSSAIGKNYRPGIVP